MDLSWIPAFNFLWLLLLLSGKHPMDLVPMSRLQTTIWRTMSKKKGHFQQQCRREHTVLEALPCTAKIQHSLQIEEFIPSHQMWEKRKEHVVREHQKEKWASATAAGLLLHSVNFIQGAPVSSHLSNPTKTLSYSQIYRTGVLIT